MVCSNIFQLLLQIKGVWHRQIPAILVQHLKQRQQKQNSSNNHAKEKDQARKQDIQ